MGHLHEPWFASVGQGLSNHLGHLFPLCLSCRRTKTETEAWRREEDSSGLPRFMPRTKEARVPEGIEGSSEVCFFLVSFEAQGSRLLWMIQRRTSK